MLLFSLSMSPMTSSTKTSICVCSTDLFLERSGSGESHLTASVDGTKSL